MGTGATGEGRTAKGAWKRAQEVVAFLLLLGSAAVAVAAARPAAEQKRIDWLIEEIRNSKGVFFRNGAEYPAAKAVSHLKFKLMMAGKRVQTARDFIEGVAAHSEESGKPYEIRLPGGTPRPMKDWLYERIAEYEKGSGARKN